MLLEKKYTEIPSKIAAEVSWETTSEIAAEIPINALFEAAPSILPQEIFFNSSSENYTKNTGGIYEKFFKIFWKNSWTPIPNSRHSSMIFFQIFFSGTASGIPSAFSLEMPTEVAPQIPSVISQGVFFWIFSENHPEMPAGVHRGI